MELDISSFDSIRLFCAAFKAKYSRLDILIHNAAYLNHGEKQYKLSPEHIELSFATNTFGPFLMTNLLTDHLQKSQDPRILNACTTNIKNFFDPKMALLILTFKLAEQLKSKGIKINALQINRVKLSKETISKLSPFWKVLATAQNLTNPPPAGMADNYFYICTSDEFRDVTGQLINHKREIVSPSKSEKGVEQLKNIFGSVSYPKYAIDIENSEKLWGLSTELTSNFY